MDVEKRTRLKTAGFEIGSTSDFLGLTPQENALIEIKLALSNALRQRRKQQHLSQIDLANHLKSSQSRVAKMEAGDPSVSFDLLIRALLVVGATREELGNVIATAAP